MAPMPGELKDLIWNAFLGLLSIFMLLSLRWIYGVNKFRKENDLMHADINRELAVVKRDMAHIGSEVRETKGLVQGVNSKVDIIQGSINTLSALVIKHIEGDK